MNPFTEDYYLRGPQKGLSNYENYRWQPEVTGPCVRRMMHWLGGQIGETVHDFGCARGYYVKALQMLGFVATGHDISTWAIENCDPFVSTAVSNHPPKDPVDWVLCKDVLEHVPESALSEVLEHIIRLTGKGALLIVPLVGHYGGKYINPADQADRTHLIAWTLPMWLMRIQSVIAKAGQPLVAGGGYHLPGVKQAADPYPASTAFITLRRFEP